jgi:uncharacterized Zn-finger protein
MELVHQQPVRWTHDRMVSCDGGGGPTGHPRIFINTDKPEISTCNYCGLPYVRVSSPLVLFVLALNKAQYLKANTLFHSLFPFSLGKRASQETPRVSPADVLPSLEYEIRRGKINRPQDFLLWQTRSLKTCVHIHVLDVQYIFPQSQFEWSPISEQPAITLKPRVMRTNTCLAPVTRTIHLSFRPSPTEKNERCNTTWESIWAARLIYTASGFGF